MKKLLLHLCCGPCAIMPIKSLERDFRLTGLFCNPNIHPLNEYLLRLEAAVSTTNSLGVELLFDSRPPQPEDFLREQVLQENPAARCAFCYQSRLEQTAKEARQRGFAAFSTTLLFSIYQDHELIKNIARQAGKDNGIDFFYLDFRPFWEEGRQQSLQMGHYRQKYCGCIFSEYERNFKKAAKKLAALRG